MGEVLGMGMGDLLLRQGGEVHGSGVSGMDGGSKFGGKVGSEWGWLDQTLKDNRTDTLRD